MGLVISTTKELLSLPFDDEVTFLIDTQGIKQWRIANERLTRKRDAHLLAIESEADVFNIDPENHLTDADIQRICTAKYLLKGWSGNITLQGDDKPIAYSEEMAIHLLETFPPISPWIINKTVEHENANYTAISETMGKLSSDSSTSSNGADAVKSKAKSQKG